MVRRGIPLPGQAERVTRRLRKAAASALYTHTGQGRLTYEEQAERIESLRQARNNAEVDAVFADLPQPHPRFSADTATMWLLFILLAWLGTIVTWVIGDMRGVWWPLAGTAVMFLVFSGINEIVVTTRQQRLWHDPHERQRERDRERLRRQRFDLSDVRIGHDERRSAAGMLVVHAAAGLPLDTYWERYERLPSVRTRGELRELFGDLPPPDPVLADTVLSKTVEEHPYGLFAGVATLVVLPGLPVTISWWYYYGQWYWLPSWATAIVVLIVVQRARLRARRARA